MAGVLSLADPILDLRDRLVARPAFRRWAARFWLTRPLARRRARALFDLGAGFVYAQVLHACVRLRLFEHLHETGPAVIETLAPRLGLAPGAARRLLEAARALDLVARRRDGRYGLGALGAAMIGNPGIVAMVEHHAMLYRDLADPVALLRGEAGDTELGRYWGYARAAAPSELPDAAIASYSALMAASQDFVAAEILDAAGLGDARRLLDVGGGEGVFLAAALRRHERLQGVLFDLPAVARRAEARLAEAGLGARAQVVGGDFRSDPLPEGADAISLVRVIHDHDDEVALALLRAAHRALPAGGLLLLAEPMADTAGAEPAGAAYFGFYLLAMGSGRPRSVDELSAMLRTAGFGQVRPVATATPLLVRALIARR